MINKRLSQRKEAILHSIISSFIDRPEPVGSKQLLRHSGLSVSTATIRSEMNELERLDYITHPHTSAGRMPTDKGYRYYVDYLISNKGINSMHIREQLRGLKREIRSMDHFFNVVSNFISGFTHQVGVIVVPILEDLNFRYANLIYLNEHKVLVVWATMSGLIKEQIVHLEGSVDQELLQKIANFMNQEFFGMPFSSIKEHIAKRIHELEKSYHRLVNITDQIVNGSIVAREEKRMWIDGVNSFFDDPDFQDVENIKPLFEALNRRRGIAEVFEQNEATDRVTVTIGQENESHEFWNCAIVKRNFFISDSLCGTLSVLGPRRMNYPEVCATVDVVSALVSDTLKEQDYS